MLCVPAIVTLSRELLFLAANVGALGSIFTFGAVKRTSPVGVQDYGGGVKSLNICPPTPNCIATSELPSDSTHYAPPLFSSLFLAE